MLQMREFENKLNDFVCKNQKHFGRDSKCFSRFCVRLYPEKEHDNADAHKF